MKIIGFFLILSPVFSAAQTIEFDYSCCKEKVVKIKADERSGIYILNATVERLLLPEPCHKGCLYTKTDDPSGELFCFGDGDIGSECRVLDTVYLFGGTTGKAEGYPCDRAFFNRESKIEAAGITEYNGSYYVCGGWVGGIRSPWCLTNLVSPTSFSHLAVMDLEKEYITLNTVGDMIVMTGGAGYTDEYDMIEILNGKKWELLMTMTSPRAQHCGTTVSNEEFILIGGLSGTNVLSTTELYNIRTKQIQPLSSMPTPRYGCACTYHSSDIYVAGGLTTYSSTQAVNTVEVYRVDTGVWQTFKEMNTGRIRFTLDVVNEVLAVFGGESTEAIQSMETYSEEDEKWIQKTTKFEHKDHLSIIIPCN
ncbi:kelch-like protein 10 isoform X2 [Eurytemora carolleeae]|uniref:kelch-like protein 10 isoform X2 n=1 Tax=Eurytemora carolleeae TaxID=1294199 RepID=UPI000C75FB78|nr:kelch-like protein 10 isoform X2 [Eurytemora carolleeae]|eukprot:XP_023321873.1 kelch-like protein 10 isoform X2 [Eurytemora affinis]